MQNFHTSQYTTGIPTVLCSPGGIFFYLLWRRFCSLQDEFHGVTLSFCKKPDRWKFKASKLPAHMCNPLFSTGCGLLPVKVFKYDNKALVLLEWCHGHNGPGNIRHTRIFMDIFYWINYMVAFTQGFLWVSFIGSTTWLHLCWVPPPPAPSFYLQSHFIFEVPLCIKENTFHVCKAVDSSSQSS